MHCLIIGSKGQLATDLKETFPPDLGTVESVGREVADVTDREAIRAVLRERGPRVVISPAAWHEVDRCQECAAEAFGVNAVGAAVVAQEASAVGARLVWFSTDFVFDGTRREPYTEAHPVSPISVYGCSKAAGERLVTTTDPAHLAIRTAALIGKAGTSGKGGNFVETMIRLAREGRSLRVVNDQTTAPTHTRDVAARTWDLVREGACGVAHLTSRGQTTWYAFTRRILETLQIDADLTGVTTKEYGAPAPRPLYSILAHETLDRLGLSPMPKWDQALTDYLEARGHLP